MTYDWTNNVYTQERSILTISAFDANVEKIQLVCGTYNISALYLKPQSGSLKIDCTDMIRLGVSGQFYVRELRADGTQVQQVQLYWICVADKNPLNSMRVATDYGNAETGIPTIAPPYSNLQSGDKIEIFCEAAGNYGYSFVSITGTESSVTSIPQGFSSIEIPPFQPKKLLKIYDISATPRELAATLSIRQGDGCVERIPVRWQSRYGHEKMAHFQVLNKKSTTDETISIETIDNTYDVRKGSVDSFSLRMEELSAYDYWYYGDIISSSRVQVYFSGAWRTVNVMTKELAIPNTDGAKTAILELNLDFREYDAV